MANVDPQFVKDYIKWELDFLEENGATIRELCITLSVFPLSEADVEHYLIELEQSGEILKVETRWYLPRYAP